MDPPPSFLAGARLEGADARRGARGSCTTLLGIGGALLGGFLASILGLGDPIDEFFDLSTWVAAIIGAVVILAVWRAVSGRRV